MALDSKNVGLLLGCKPELPKKPQMAKALSIEIPKPQGLGFRV